MSHFGGDPVTQLIVNVYQMIKMILQIHMELPLLSTGSQHHAVKQLSLSVTVHWPTSLGNSPGYYYFSVMVKVRVR